MASNYKKLGEFLRLTDERNSDLSITNLQGVSISKQFIPSIANIIGTDLSSYKIVRKGQFAYGPVTSRNGDKVSIALLDSDDCIISSSYLSFEVVDKTKLDPEYLMLWFMRPEFDRYARFMSNGSAREIFDWECMCGVELPVPSIEEQRKIVNDYKVISDRIELLEKINENLEEQASCYYKNKFVDNAELNRFKKHKLKEFVPIITGKKDANVACQDGKYQFFSCSIDTLWTNEYSFDTNAILVAGNGDFSVKWYSGKFEAYQRTYVLVPIDLELRDLLYYAVKYYLPFATSAARGSVISFITKGILEEIELFMPNEIELENECKIFKRFNYLIDLNRIEILAMQKTKDNVLKNISKEVG